MPFSFKPDHVFDDYSSVTPELLRSMGVKLLLTDLDYTLAPKRQSEPDEALLKWTAQLKESGIALAILSNNRSSERVERFCSGLGIFYVGHAGKPSVRGFTEAMRRCGVTAAETAMLGDKLLTDTLGAKRSGILMLMVEPKGGPVGAWNRILHALQEPFKRVSGHDARSRK
ncbi:MAG: YqeG family HAD IIIA-type phosphatase [Oscillospiraceae bacterium]|nr:YqeG family HAD IIIA-type phosphatase [Oscillospiraceae bacterium]